MQQEELFPDGQSGRTSSELCPAGTVTTLRQSSKKWLGWGRVSLNGQSLTHSSSESPKGVDECSSSLALILQQPTDVASKYFLSAKAAEGILRRANRRGKTLPEQLQQALEIVALSGGLSKSQP